jgi:TPR repeat protein
MKIRKITLALILCLASLEMAYSQNWEVLEESAEAGDIEAQMTLGFAYLEGEGVEQDDIEASYWFLLAAEEDHPDAQYILGAMIQLGRGFTQDLEKAARYYAYAANQGHAYAQYELANAYLNGRGRPMDPGLAYMWYAIAYDTASALDDSDLMKRANAGRELAALELSSTEIIDLKLKAMNFSPSR